MEQKKKEAESSKYTMRSLHRDIGFFIIGLVIIYSISGILLIYRDTLLLKQLKPIEKKLSPNLNEAELGNAIHIKEFKITKSNGDTLYFEDGTYNKVTGAVRFTSKELPFILKSFTRFHKTAAKNIVHWFNVIFAVLLLFMAISSFWMFKPKTKMFRRGLYIAGAGIVFAAILLFL